MTFLSDRERLEAELEQIELFLSKNEVWDIEVSRKYIRREEIKFVLKSLGKKDWL